MNCEKCNKPIPEARKVRHPRSVTCSNECGKALRREKLRGYTRESQRKIREEYRQQKETIAQLKEWNDQQFQRIKRLEQMLSEAMRGGPVDRVEQMLFEYNRGKHSE